MKDSEKKELLSFLDEMASTITQMFGQDCEVCVSDLKDGISKVLLIHNGHVTGRSVGMTLNDEARIRVREGLDGSYINYYKRSRPTKALLKASTIVKRIGDFQFTVCINYDVTKIENMQTVFNSFMNVTDIYDENDFFELSSVADFRRILDENLLAIQKTVTSLNRKERIAIVRDFYQRGCLRLKGSVQSIAALLMITRATMYNYLREINAQDEAENEKKENKLA